MLLDSQSPSVSEVAPASDAGAPVVVASRCVPAFLRYVRERGGDAERLRATFGLSPDVEQRASAPMTPVDLARFGRACAEASCDEHLGLTVAGRTARGGFGLVEFAVRSSPTLRHALTSLQRYVRLVAPQASLSVEEEAGTGLALVTERTGSERQGLGRECNEFILASLLLVPRTLVGPRFTPTRVWFAHDRPAGGGELFRFRGLVAALSYGAGGNGFAFPRALLDVPLREADPALAAVLEVQAGRELELLPKVDSLDGAVRAAMRQRLEQGEPKLDVVADALRLSSRTLQRRLGQLGTTFQRELETVRRELAERLLFDARQPLSEISWRLGYADVGAFVRAYRGWTGQTPGAAREQVLGQAQRARA